ncbi:MAG: OmpA family protein [Myxococcales bacterium]|nr:OmpA family protein [Myxococcales bacterium]
MRSFSHTAKRAAKLAALGVAIAFVAACGIPEEKHKKVLDQLSKLKAEMAADQKACKDAKDKLSKKNSDLEAENGALKTKLTSLGQDVTKLKTQAGRMVQSLSEKQQRIAQLERLKEAFRRQANTYKNLLGKFKKMIDAGTLKVSIRDGRMIVQLSDKILFAPGKARLKKDGKEKLKEVAAILASMSDQRFQVAGHTDNIPIKTRRFRSNWELSTARAVNVVKFMSKNGMDPKRLSAAGYSQYDPVGDNSTDAGRQVNRRIEITIVPDLSKLPFFGKKGA